MLLNHNASLLDNIGIYNDRHGIGVVQSYLSNICLILFVNL